MKPNRDVHSIFAKSFTYIAMDFRSDNYTDRGTSCLAVCSKSLCESHLGSLLYEFQRRHLSLAIIATLFTMIFKFLPDVKVAWRDVWLGGIITALLFNFGKVLIGIYIGRSSISSVYGAMDSLFIVLLWVYYSAQILFFGAQFTCFYATRFGVKPNPVRGAEFIPTAVKYNQARPQRIENNSCQTRQLNWKVCLHNFQNPALSLIGLIARGTVHSSL